MHAYGYAFQIHSIDINQVTLQLPDVIFHKGDANRLERSFPPEFMRSQARPLLVIEDSSHDMTTSLAVLNFFHNWLAAGEYIVIEDGIITDMGYTEKYGGGPRAAVEQFLATHASEIRNGLTLLRLVWPKCNLERQRLLASAVNIKTHGGMTTVDSHNRFRQPAPSVRSRCSSRVERIA